MTAQHIETRIKSFGDFLHAAETALFSAEISVRELCEGQALENACWDTLWGIRTVLYGSAYSTGWPRDPLPEDRLGLATRNPVA